MSGWEALICGHGGHRWWNNQTVAHLYHTHAHTHTNTKNYWQQAELFTQPHFHAHKCMEIYKWEARCTHTCTQSLQGTHRSTHVHVRSGLNCYGAWCCFTGPDKDKVDQIPSSCFSLQPFTFLLMCQWHTPCLSDGALIEKEHIVIYLKGGGGEEKGSSGVSWCLK